MTNPLRKRKLLQEIKRRLKKGPRNCKLQDFSVRKSTEKQDKYQIEIKNNLKNN